MKKCAIYSAIVGGYDEILQPVFVDNRFDFILFTNEISVPQVGIWKIRKIEYHNSDNTRICRYVKTHPETLLAEYDSSVWIDSNIQIRTNYLYDTICKMEDSSTLISSMWHPTRDCIFDEAFAIMNMQLEHERTVVKWCHQLRREKYPRHNGLYETNVLYRKHNSRIIQEMDTLWWQCIERNSRRDQLSINYVLWKKNIPCTYLFGEGFNARNTDSLCVIQHKDIKHNHCPIDKNEAWLMRHCWKDKKETNRVASIYYHLYAAPFPFLGISLAGLYFRIVDHFRYQ